jgi:hypothetical protein
MVYKSSPIQGPVHVLQHALCSIEKHKGVKVLARSTRGTRLGGN